MLWVVLLVLALVFVGAGFFAFQRRPSELEKKVALTGWAGEYDAWLTELQEVITKFPDQGELEGKTYSEAEASIVNEINDLFVDEMYQVTTRLVLKGAALKRITSEKK